MRGGTGHGLKHSCLKLTKLICFVFNHLPHVVLMAQVKMACEVSTNVVGVTVRISDADGAHSGFAFMVLSHVL